MPIAYRIDYGARVVVAVAYGVLTDGDVFKYQREVWSRTDVEGFDELVDMSRVAEVILPTQERIQDLASVAAEMDAPTSSRMAVVAPDEVTFGLGRMFMVHRRLERDSTKEVGVFRTSREALDFLGLEHPLLLPALTLP